MRTTHIITALGTIVWSLALGLPAGAQAPAAATRAATEHAAYAANGRRDPFVSLALSGDALKPSASRPAGVRGLLIAELSLKGVVRSDNQLLAAVEGPDKRTYTVRNGEQLQDGSVKVISPDAVVFLQQVTDPLSPIKQREIRKTLRTTEANR